MTIDDLKQYILRKLGSPVINVELADEQLTDAISDSFEVFGEYHTDGFDIGYVIFDLVKDQLTYTLPDSVSEVLAILPSSNYAIDTEEPLLLKPFYLGNEDTFGNNFDLIDVEIFRQNLKNVQNSLEKNYVFEFNSTTKTLTLFVQPSENKKVLLHIYRGHEDPSKIYRNRWFKQYCVALAGLQWAVNISKYEGGKLPGGVNINATTIEERYNTKRETLEDELHERFEEPPDMFIG